MVSQVEQWKSAARSIFAAFGDAVFDTNAKMYEDGADPVYDEDTGTTKRPVVSATTKTAFVQLSRVKFEKVFGSEIPYVETQKTAYILPPEIDDEGSIVYGRPSVGDLLQVFTDPTNDDDPGESFKVEAVNTDTANVKAYYVVMLSPISEAAYAAA